MITIPYTEDMVKEARKRAKKMGRLDKSITEGRGNFTGFIAEIAIAEYYGAKVVADSQYTHDLIMPDGVLVEVKAKRRTVPAKFYFDASIADASKHQISDNPTYFFASVHINDRDVIQESGIQLIGMIEAEEYHAKAKFWKKGEVEVRANRRFKFHVDTWNLVYSELHPISYQSVKKEKSGAWEKLKRQEAVNNLGMRMYGNAEGSLYRTYKAIDGHVICDCMPPQKIWRENST